MTTTAVEFVVKHLVVGAGAVGLAVGARLSREVSKRMKYGLDKIAKIIFLDIIAPTCSSCYL